MIDVNNIDERQEQRHGRSPVFSDKFRTFSEAAAAPSRPFLGNILLLGAPGGGKGTISKKLLGMFKNLKHISTGDVLRREVERDTSLGQKVREKMQAGGLVDDETVMRALRAEAERGEQHRRDGGSNFLFDGCARNVAQAQQLEEEFGIGLAIHVRVPFEEIIRRVSARWIHPSSQRSYNTLVGRAEQDVEWQEHSFVGEDVDHHDDCSIVPQAQEHIRRCN